MTGFVELGRGCVVVTSPALALEAARALALVVEERYRPGSARAEGLLELVDALGRMAETEVASPVASPVAASDSEAPRGWVSVMEVARRVGVSRQAVERHLGGRLRAVKVDRRWLVDPDSIEAWVRDREGSAA